MNVTDLLRLTEAINQAVNPQMRETLLQVFTASANQILKELKEDGAQKKHKCCQAKKHDNKRGDDVS